MASVILTSSTVATAANSGASIYSATKGAVNKIAQIAANELAYRKIRVNLLSPGPVETPGFDKATLGMPKEAFSSVTALQRMGPGLTGLGIRAGIGGISGSGDQGQVTLISLPILVNYVLGDSRASVESGLGLMASYVTAAGKDALTGNYATAQGAGISVAGNFGLRLQPKQNGVHFRLYWSPFITDHGLQPQWLGLSLGYGFR